MVNFFFLIHLLLGKGEWFSIMKNRSISYSHFLYNFSLNAAGWNIITEREEIEEEVEEETMMMMNNKMRKKLKKSLDLRFSYFNSFCKQCLITMRHIFLSWKKEKNERGILLAVSTYICFHFIKARTWSTNSLNVAGFSGL